MSVEAYVIAAIIDEGSPKKAFQAGISKTDFIMHEDEFDWIVQQMEGKRPVNWRRFQNEFPDFEKVILDERLQDLCIELKREAAFVQISSALNQVADELTPENSMDKAHFLYEVMMEVLRAHSPSSDISLSEHKPYLKRMRELMLLRENGHTPGMPTGIASLDLHYGGLQNGRTILILGRPGDAKSMFQAKMACHAFLDNRRGAMFSPEMNEEEHRARLATLLSAVPRVQEELGLNKSFRNRALLDGRGYNYKTYKRFWEWFSEQQGDIILFNQTHRRQKMTPAYIESKIDDLGLEWIMIDPLYKMRSGVRGLKGWEELAAITDMVCDLAESHNIPVMMSNQAGRHQGNRGDAPHKDSSFNGDAPVQEADHVIGVKNVPEELKLILRCTKNRHGQDFRVDLKFVPNIGIMDDISFKDFNYYNGNEDGSQPDNDKMKEAMSDLEKEMEHDAR